MKNVKLNERRTAGWLRDGGQALVEAAIAAPIFFLLLMGSAELARMAYTAIEIQNAAEAGALYAIENSATMGDSAGIKAAAQADAANLSGVTIAAPTYTHSCSDGSTYTASSQSCTSGWVESSIQLTTSVSFDPLVHIPGLTGKFTMHGFAVERCENC